MSGTEDKLRKIAKPAPEGGWKDRVKFRNENKGWLKKSSAIALRVLETLDTLGWSQARLARELGVSRQMVSKIVKGQEKFNIETITNLEEALGIQLITILMSDEEVVKKAKIKYINETFYGENKFLKEMQQSEFNQEVKEQTPDLA
ncbi:Helix-turn-helix motif protein [Fulvivirga imtechensis AK7]|uniref:Helix-turn-helix motif protein n=1 Tax=Fulvivirga imtechensis AK7 TaxID=1237149 RepID=L8JV61_9BACT|nr:helix-turn-helix transcriptional regulator [Fulvivirga imtechensis]ELR71147.1 Helix-turn-helix motif protein [Fulvivirga imtechensis AK7]